MIPHVYHITDSTGQYVWDGEGWKHHRDVTLRPKFILLGAVEDELDKMPDMDVAIHATICTGSVVDKLLLEVGALPLERLDGV